MKDKRKKQVFLERRTYRRRRMMDAARLFPLLGAGLFAVPLLWPQSGTGVVPMSRAMIYVFGVWGALIVLGALLGAASRRWGQSDSPHPPGQE